MGIPSSCSSSSALPEEFNITWARGFMIYWDSNVKVASAGILVKTGRKWQAQVAVDRVEARLRHTILVGAVEVGREEPDSFPKPRYNKAWEVEEERYSKMAGMYKQGTWTRWEHAEPWKITWTELWRAGPLHTESLTIRIGYNATKVDGKRFCYIDLRL